jgi:hypothetical protein
MKTLITGHLTNNYNPDHLLLYSFFKTSICKALDLTYQNKTALAQQEDINRHKILIPVKYSKCIKNFIIGAQRRKQLLLTGAMDRFREEM